MPELKAVSPNDAQRTGLGEVRVIELRRPG
jgi:hypothetical protein